MFVPTIEEHFKDVPLFKNLTHDELAPIVRISNARFYKERMYVFMQDDPLDRVFFIQSGKIKIYKTDVNGKEQIVSILTAGEMFPHAGFFRKGGYPAHAEVIEDTQLIVTPIDQFEEILLQYPELCIKLFKVLGEKIVDLQNRLEEQILHNAYEQIGLLFLRLSHIHGEKESEDKYRLTTSFTHKELANMIGTSRETMSRTITYFKKKGYVEQNACGYYLINYKTLQKHIIR
ncbi:Crp/Fnr family transcriptional regulator [Bacillus timonensis]|nr:Crp/Fnr family transcriptional regulator [Bacillus timonensis]